MVEVSDKIEVLALDKIKEYPHNNKIHPESQVNKIIKSIETFGFRNPILLDGDGEIIAGHGRYLAAKEMGLDSVPCILDEDCKKTK